MERPISVDPGDQTCGGSESSHRSDEIVLSRHPAIAW